MLSHNVILKINFPHDPEAYDYEANIKDGNVNVRQFQHIFPTASPLLELVGIDGIFNITNTPIALHYYDTIDDETTAYTIDEGVAIVVKEHDEQSFLPYLGEVGYGLYSLPTDVNGWRFVKPFRTSDEDVDDKLYYIKRDDLISVSRAWVNENKGLVQLGKQMEISKSKIIEQLTLQVDKQLYDHGIYLSPALLKSIFPISSVFLLALTIMTFIAWRFYAKREL